MIAKGQFAAARLGVGGTYDTAKLGREVMADAMPMLLVLTTALNYAHFKMLGSQDDLPGGLGFSFGPEAISQATYDIGRMVMPDYYDRIFTFKHDDKGCWISMRSHTPIAKGMETQFQATVDHNGKFFVTTRDLGGNTVNQARTENAQDIVDLCTDWIRRNFSETERRVIAAYTIRLAAGMSSDRSATPTWVNRFAAV